MKGFTLLEILIAVGILATVSTLIAQVLFTTTHVNTKSVLVSEIKQNGNHAIESMDRVIRGAVSIDTACAPGAPSTVVTDVHGDTVTFDCVSDGTAARIASVSSSGTAYLTGSGVTLSLSGGASCADSSLVFTCPAEGGLTRSVTIQFSLGQLGASANAFDTARSAFSDTVSLRNVSE